MPNANRKDRWGLSGSLSPLSDFVQACAGTYFVQIITRAYVPIPYVPRHGPREQVQLGDMGEEEHQCVSKVRRLTRPCACKEGIIIMHRYAGKPMSAVSPSSTTGHSQCGRPQSSYRNVGSARRPPAGNTVK